MKFFFATLALAGLVGFAAPQASAQLYEARTSSVNFEKKERAAVKVQVEGTAAWTRDFWQSWIKDTYNIRLKGDGVFGVGKKDVLAAKQTPASSVSGKLIDFYSMITSPSDTTSELSIFAAFGPDTFLDPDKTTTEFAALRTMGQSFAVAARQKAYKEKIAEAEKQLKEAEKEKERLQKEISTLEANTTSNLARIEALKQTNASNALKAREDSVKLVTNGQQMELRKIQLQKRRDRLSALDRK
ncbi:hypothetical protein [Hymenobacter cellulosivorans]|uniref:Uncharacterized protein n=1 Tax=Hymenobacter cellulosivorans TaxID=2932249 RepID=A0ABY4F9B9_9BACT|nr:hypothetical protein [Hymenobacter cellulosivorans]UOQ53256.1 hypothetical protein MUN80_00505 [Hymenobacter cellulosivorans]